MTNVTLRFHYGGLLCVFLSSWNSYRSLTHRGKSALFPKHLRVSPNVRRRCGRAATFLQLSEYIFEVEVSFGVGDFFLPSRDPLRQSLNSSVASCGWLSGLGYCETGGLFGSCVRMLSLRLAVVFAEQRIQSREFNHQNFNFESSFTCCCARHASTVIPSSVHASPRFLKCATIRSSRSSEMR